MASGRRLHRARTNNMKKISRLAALIVLLASSSAPLFAVAANSGGCSSAGPACTINTANDGVCSQNTESGDYYCKPNGIGLPSGTVAPSSNTVVPQTPGTGVPNLNVITPYSEGIKNLINDILVPVLMAIAFIVFLWGVYKYFIYGADNETERATGKQFVLWGIIGFVVILSVWGLVAIVSGTLGLQLGGGSPTPPTFTVPK